MSRDDISVTVSAPGKVILYGEHSVVYGKLAIASSLGLRTTVTLQENRSGILAIVLKDLNFSKEYDLKDFSNITIPLSPDNKYSWKHPNNIAFESLIETIADSFRLQDAYKKDESLTLTALFYLYCGIVKNVPVDGLLLEVSTDLTLGSGTGSSASVMVALAGAFVKYRLAKTENAEADKQFVIGELNIISDWAFHAEKIIHGNPSGIDNTICCFGSMVSFRKGVEPQPIKTTHEIRCILVDTKVPKDTKVQVRKVADLKQRFPKVVDAVLNGMDELTSEAAECLFCLGLAEELPNSFDEIYNRLNVRYLKLFRAKI